MEAVDLIEWSVSIWIQFIALNDSNFIINDWLFLVSDFPKGRYSWFNTWLINLGKSHISVDPTILLNQCNIPSHGKTKVWGVCNRYEWNSQSIPNNWWHNTIEYLVCFGGRHTPLQSKHCCESIGRSRMAAFLRVLTVWLSSSLVKNS